jgi:hypothetical protein
MRLLGFINIRSLNAITTLKKMRQINDVAGLFRLTSDSSASVVRLVCDAFCRLTEIFVDQLAPHMPGLVNVVVVVRFLIAMLLLTFCCLIVRCYRVYIALYVARRRRDSIDSG